MFLSGVVCGCVEVELCLAELRLVSDSPINPMQISTLPQKDSSIDRVKHGKCLLPVVQKLKFRRLLASDELDQPTLGGAVHLVHRSPAFPCKQLLSGLIESIAPVSEHVP